MFSSLLSHSHLPFVYKRNPPPPIYNNGVYSALLNDLRGKIVSLALFSEAYPRQLIVLALKITYLVQRGEGNPSTWEMEVEDQEGKSILCYIVSWKLTQLHEALALKNKTKQA